MPSSTIVTSEEAAKLNDANYLVLDSSTLKTCRLYLRIKHFYVNVDVLSGQLLHYYYEQVRFDTIKQQNWLNLDGFRDVFYNIAARSLWLSYGSDITHHLEKKQFNMYYHLPQCQWEAESLDILKKKLERINDDMKTDGCDDTKSCDSRSESQSLRSDSHSLRSVDADNEFIMLSAIKESLKLPFYGIYYYHVNFIRHEELPPICCKLGVGPFGITIAVTSDYTTWEEVESWNWSTVGDIKRDHNILEIHETTATCTNLNTTRQNTIHLFQCIDEREAKYLIDELQEIYSFQMTVVNRNKRLRTGKQSRIRRSIGILSNESTSCFLTPVASRSTSMTVLKYPMRKASVDLVKEPKPKTSLALMAFRKSSCI